MPIFHLHVHADTPDLYVAIYVASLLLVLLNGLWRDRLYSRQVSYVIIPFFIFDHFVGYHLADFC